MKKILGRPVDKTLEVRLFDATLSLCESVGYRNLTLEKIANQAGTSRQTIYRKYAGLDKLLALSVQYYYKEDAPADPTGDVLEDIVNHLHGTVKILTQTRVGKILKFILAEFAHNENYRELTDQIGTVRRKDLEKLIEQAIQSGIISSQTQVDVLIDGLIGAIFFRFLLTQRVLDKRYVRKLLLGLVSLN